MTPTKPLVTAKEVDDLPHCEVHIVIEDDRIKRTGNYDCGIDTIALMVFELERYKKELLAIKFDADDDTA